MPIVDFQKLSLVIYNLQDADLPIGNWQSEIDSSPARSQPGKKLYPSPNAFLWCIHLNIRYTYTPLCVDLTVPC